MTTRAPTPAFAARSSFHAHSVRDPETPGEAIRADAVESVKASQARTVLYIAALVVIGLMGLSVSLAVGVLALNSMACYWLRECP